MKLLLADDHTLFRDALVQYIERGEPAARITLAKDFPEVIEVLRKDSAQDLILLDLRMPGMNGMEGFKAVRLQYPDIPVVLMSGMAETKDVEVAMEMGARGYFPKTMSGKALLGAIQTVLSGENFMPMDARGNSIMPSYYGDKTEGARTSGRADSGLDVNLTPREKEVLSFLARGASNKEIANELGLQLVTVKLHVRGVCRKLDAKNRTQAALKAREMGIGS